MTGARHFLQDAWIDGALPHTVLARATTSYRPPLLADWILADRLPVRFQLQLHKVLWGDVPGK